MMIHVLENIGGFILMIVVLVAVFVNQFRRNRSNSADMHHSTYTGGSLIMLAVIVAFILIIRRRNRKS